MNLLWGILHEKLKLVLKARDDLLSQGVMTFEYLVRIFSSYTFPFDQIVVELDRL